MNDLQTCPCCGLTQHVPPVEGRMRAFCARCESRLPLRGRPGSNAAAGAVALAALLLYPFGISLPMLQLEQYGHRSDSSIISGTISLLGQGQIIVGLVVLVCSVVFPLTKLISLLVLAAGAPSMPGRHRALTYRVVEWTGRWGMLDVLLVAVLVAALKLGDMVQVSAGPAAFAFTLCVVLSLIATAMFDPHKIWDATPVTEDDS